MFSSGYNDGVFSLNKLTNGGSVGSNFNFA